MTERDKQDLNKSEIAPPPAKKQKSVMEEQMTKPSTGNVITRVR